MRQKKPDQSERRKRTEELEEPDQEIEEENFNQSLKPVLRGLHPFTQLVCPFCGGTKFGLDENFDLFCSSCTQRLSLFEMEDRQLLRPYLAEMAKTLPPFLSEFLLDLKASEIENFKMKSAILKMKIMELVENQAELDELYAYLQTYLADYLVALDQKEQEEAEDRIKDISVMLDLICKDLPEFESFAFATRYAIKTADQIKESEGSEKEKEIRSFLEKAREYASQALKLAKNSKSENRSEWIEEAKDLKALAHFRLAAFAQKELKLKEALNNYRSMYELLFDPDTKEAREILEKDLILSLPAAALYYEEQRRNDMSQKLLRLFEQRAETLWKEHPGLETLDLQAKARIKRISYLFTRPKNEPALKEIEAWKAFWNSKEVISLLKAKPNQSADIYVKNLIELQKETPFPSEGAGIKLLKSGLSYLSRHNKKLHCEGLVYAQAVLNRAIGDYYFSDDQVSNALAWYGKLNTSLNSLLKQWPQSPFLMPDAFGLGLEPYQKVCYVQSLFGGLFGESETTKIMMIEMDAFLLQARMRLPGFRKNRQFRKYVKKLCRTAKRYNQPETAQELRKLLQKS